jgi:hypothetical protein
MMGRTKRWMLPLMAISMTIALAGAAHAQYSQSGTSATLRISFGTTPHWTTVQGTRVEELPSAERPGYDVFRYGGSYYAYNNDRWYMSHRESGDFTMIDDPSVPNELSMVPREHWRNYPSRWQDRQYQGSGSSSMSLQVNFGRPPRWTSIQGTRVEELPSAEGPGYDVFRYGGNYYAYNNDRWYTSRRESGEFIMIDDANLPDELSMVPREHWRNYPSRWQDRDSQRSGWQDRDHQGSGYQDRDHQGSRGSSVSFQVNFGRQPRWTSVRGTRVYMIRGSRPEYDMFRYGNNYYVYSNDQWYMCRTARGNYVAINDRYVPNELYRVPRHEWRNYPSGWLDGNGNPRYGRYGRDQRAGGGRN